MEFTHEQITQVNNYFNQAYTSVQKQSTVQRSILSVLVLGVGATLGAYIPTSPTKSPAVAEYAQQVQNKKDAHDALIRLRLNPESVLESSIIPNLTDDVSSTIEALFKQKKKELEQQYFTAEQFLQANKDEMNAYQDAYSNMIGYRISMGFAGMAAVGLVFGLGRLVDERLWQQRRYVLQKMHPGNTRKP